MMDPSTPYGPLSLNLAVLELEVYFSAVPPRISLILSERVWTTSQLAYISTSFIFHVYQLDL